MSGLPRQSSAKEGIFRQGSPLSSTTLYIMKIYYDNLNNVSIQRVSTVPNSTTVVGSAAVRRISPQPNSRQMLQPHATNNPHINVTPPSASTVGTLSQNSYAPSNMEPPRNDSPSDDLPLLSALGVNG